MRQRRKGRRSRPVLELVGPRLRGGEDAVAALRMSWAGVASESVVVLVCDGELGVMLAVELEEAPAAGVATAVGLVLEAVPEGSKLVVGIFRRDGSMELDRLELEAVEGVAAACRRHGSQLVDVFVVAGDRSMRVGAAASGDE